MPNFGRESHGIGFGNGVGGGMLVGPNHPLLNGTSTGFGRGTGHGPMPYARYDPIGPILPNTSGGLNPRRGLQNIFYIFQSKSHTKIKYICMIFQIIRALSPKPKKSIL